MKRKRIQFRITHNTPTGQFTEIKEKQDGTDKLDYRYMGLSVTHCHQSFPVTEYLETGEITTSTGIVKRFIGNTVIAMNDDETAQLRHVNTISGRQKPVKNKVAMGELRRKRTDNRATSFGVSRSKAYHKAKHSN